jgi:hypothetical protein
VYAIGKISDIGYKKIIPEITIVTEARNRHILCRAFPRSPSLSSAKIFIRVYAAKGVPKKVQAL